MLIDAIVGLLTDAVGRYRETFEQKKKDRATEEYIVSGNYPHLVPYLESKRIKGFYSANGWIEIPA